MIADLVAFLRAREAEREQDARASAPGPWRYQDVDSVGGGRVCDPTVAIASLHYEQPGEVDPRIRRTVLPVEADGTGAHIARHDPARVLADVEAKRRIIDLHEPVPHALTAEEGGGSYLACAVCPHPRIDVPHVLPCETLRLLALPYAGHRGYRAEWAPDR